MEALNGIEHMDRRMGWIHDIKGINGLRTIEAS